MSTALRVRLGDVERWNIVNSSNNVHLLHIHNIQFQILDRNGATPAQGQHYAGTREVPLTAIVGSIGRYRLNWGARLP